MEQTSAGTRIVDQTRTEDGQPYFLPKGLIHLVIAPQGAADTNGGPSGAGGAGAATAPATPRLENHLSYKVTAEVKLVPDRETGPLYAHYSPNWLFADNTAISVTPDGLLSAVTSTAEDRSPQIFSNLEDTAVDLGEFFAAGGLPKFPTTTSNPGSAALPAALKGGAIDEQKPTEYKEAVTALLQQNEPTLSKVRRTIFEFGELKWRLERFEQGYRALQGTLAQDRPKLPDFYLKRLNVDEWFDPFDPQDVARVESLFADHPDGRVPEFSPVRLEMRRGAPARGESCPNSGPRRDGLWFREPTQIELTLRPNELYTRYLRPQLVSKSQMAAKTDRLINDRDAAAYLSTELGKLLDAIKSSNDALDDLWLHPPSPQPGQPPKANQPAEEASPTPAAGAPAAAPATPPPLPPQDLKHDGKRKKPAPLPTQEGGPVGGSSFAADEAPQPAPNEAPWSERNLQADLRYLADQAQALLFLQPTLAHLSDDVGKQIAAVTAQINSDRDQSYHGNLPGEVAGLGTFSLTVPNKQRPFSLNVPRSAFVVRSMTLTIQNGVLLGFNHNKPSEVEGFTTIPLTLAKKLADVPKSLFTARNDTLQGQDTLLKSRTQLINDQQALGTAAHPPQAAASTVPVATTPAATTPAAASPVPATAPAIP